MKPGKFLDSIVIERLTETHDEFRTPVRAWAPIATLAAQAVKISTDEFVRNAGETVESVAIFRTWHVDDVHTSDRVMFRGQVYEIRAREPLGVLGMELRCSKAGS